MPKELQDLISDTLNEMPPVTVSEEESLIAADSLTTESAENQAEKITGVMNNGITDSAGDYFDSSIHAENEDGTPRLTATGKFRKKHKSKIKESASTLKVNLQAEQESANFRAIGAMATMMLTNSLSILISDEFKPSETETVILSDSFAKYFEAKGVEDVSPSAALALVLISYTMPRLTQPKTKSWFQKRKESFILFMFERKKKKAEKLAREKAERELNEA